MGCGTGALAAAAREAGWQVVATEFSSTGAAIARDRMGLDVREGPFRAAQFGCGERFDLVTMIHVLEHLRNPSDALTTVASLLPPGGHVFIEVPNPRCPGVWISRPVRRKIFDMPLHLHHFSSRSLSLMLERAGLEVDQVQASVPKVVDAALGSVVSWVSALRRMRSSRRTTRKKESPGREGTTGRLGGISHPSPGTRLVQGVRRVMPGWKLVAVGRKPRRVEAP